MIVLKEPKKLSVDPPFGPPLPPHFLSDYSDVATQLQNRTGLAADSYCPVLDPQLVNTRQAVLSDCLAKWYAKAESDLIAQLGSKLKPSSRGEPSRAIKVNLINTFKTPAGNYSVEAQATRWVQFRFTEFAAALKAWQGNTVYPASLKAYRRITALASSTVHKGKVNSPFAKSNSTLISTWIPQIKKFISQLNELIRLTGFRRPEPTIVASLVAMAQMHGFTAASTAEDIEKAELETSSQTWKDWVLNAGQASAGIAHKYVKAPLAISSRELYGTQLSRSDELTAQVDTWSQLWLEGKGPSPPTFGLVPRLPPLAPKMLVLAANTFKRATCALGGIHPRHIALLSHAALTSLIAILHSVEAWGVLPSQLCNTLIALFPKPDGGLRPIAWVQSVLRVWAKARHVLVGEWEKSYTGGLPFAAQKDRSPVDCVWRHSFRAEVAQTSGNHFACVLLDLKKCYEMIDHCKLTQAAHKHMYPLALLRISIFLYRSPRRILYNGIVSRCIEPARGILAGISSATTELRLMLLDAVVAHVHTHPAINLNVFVDDLAVDATADCVTDLVEDITVATTDLVDFIEGKLELPIARSKSAVLANTSTTARALRRCLGDLGGPPLGSVRSLGIDFWGGNPQNNRKRPVKTLRRKVFAAKRHRLSKLRASSPAAAAKVFVCGMMPSVLFDSPVLGIFGHELKKLRRQAGMFLGLRGRKKAPNLALSFVPSKDPEVVSALGLVKQYCKEVWSAALPPPYRNPAANSLASIATGVAAYLRRNTNPPHCFKSRVNGPISALHRVLHVAGWVFNGPFVLTTKSGVQHNLTSVCPRRILHYFKIDLMETIRRRDVVTPHMRHTSDETQPYWTMAFSLSLP